MTRLLVRIQTSFGPRTLISQNFDSETAWAISNALDASEIENRLTENATPLPLKALIRRRAKQAKPIPKPIVKPAGNVMKLPVKGGK